MKSPRSITAVLLVAAAASAGCSDLTFVGGDPAAFELTIEGSATPLVGDTAAFRYQASGTSLSGVILEYGDGVADSIGTFGAVTASGVAVHTYAEAGSYVVEGRLEDAVQGVVRDEVTVEVLPHPGG